MNLGSAKQTRYNQSPQPPKEQKNNKKIQVTKPIINEEILNSEGRMLSSIKHMGELDIKNDSFDNQVHQDKLSSFKKSKFTLDDMEESSGLMLQMQSVRMVNSHVRVLSFDKDLQQLKPLNQQIDSFLDKREP